jgi:hypothetical protein
MTLKIEMGKQYRTRDGRAVRIICVDRQGSGLWPVIGLLTEKNGKEYTYMWPESGHRYEDNTDSLDLIEVKPRLSGTFWANIYKNSKIDNLIAYPNKDLADYSASSSRLACVPITIDCEEGEGLDK